MSLTTRWPQSVNGTQSQAWPLLLLSKMSDHVHCSKFCPLGGSPSPLTRRTAQIGVPVLQLVPAYYTEPSRNKAWVFPSSASCPQRTPHETMCMCWRCGKRKDRIWALPCAFKAWVAQAAWWLGDLWYAATWQGPSYKGDLGSGRTGLIRKETPQV